MNEQAGSRSQHRSPSCLTTQRCRPYKVLRLQALSHSGRLPRTPELTLRAGRSCDSELLSPNFV